MSALTFVELMSNRIFMSILPSRYAHRSFGPSHWRLVQQKLRVLRKQVATAVETLNRNKTAAVATN